MLPAIPDVDLICPLMSVPVSGKQGFQHRLGGFLVKAMLGGAGRDAEGLLQKRQTDTLRTPDIPAAWPGSRVSP